MYYETQTYTNQFVGINPINEVGNPLFGKPAGYGISQIDPVNNTNQLWDWVANLDGAITLFKDKVGSLNRYVRQVREGREQKEIRKHHFEIWEKGKLPDAAEFNNYQANVDLHQLYNSGHFYTFEPVQPNNHHLGGHWVASTKRYKGQYRYNQEMQIRVGILPKYWDDYYKGCTP